MFRLLAGCSRYVLRWEVGGSMTEANMEKFVPHAREKLPVVASRIMPYNATQFIFKDLIRLCAMTRVQTSPYAKTNHNSNQLSHGSYDSVSRRPIIQFLPFKQKL
jgi:hypothetical protein